MKKFNFYISEGGRTGFPITIIAKDRDDAMDVVVKRYPNRGIKRILTSVEEVTLKDLEGKKDGRGKKDN